MKNKSSIIRDPLHGSIEFSKQEMAIINHYAFQRLRNIKQTSFADFAFPGATHTRYGHSLGAMHTATLMFERIFEDMDLNAEQKSFLRQTVRLAALLHDVGHAPFSHSMESMMPPRSSLMPPLASPGVENRKATHEDFTLTLILDSDLSRHIDKHFSDMGVTPQVIASLFAMDESFDGFVFQGINYLPILKQIISSDCDADRMDYLQRDSLYCGVNYGKFDAEWLINNLIPVVQNDNVFLGIKAKAIFSFEDFLLSRYHMFASVYFHHTPVIFDHMLQKSFEESDFMLPADLEDYLQLDDIEIIHLLRRSSCELARRIVERKPYVLLNQFMRDSNKQETQISFHKTLSERLNTMGIKHMRVMSSGFFSKHIGYKTIPMYVREHNNQTLLLENYTPLFKRYGAGAEIYRIFVEPERLLEAQNVMTTDAAKIL